MNHDLETNFLNSTDEEIHFCLGLPDFHKSYKSYGKILYNHSILTYDDESIYFIDKLHLTFSSSQPIENKVVEAFYKRKQFKVNEHLIIKPNYRNGNNYHYSFIIEYDGNNFGYLHLNNTKRINISKIEIDNRILYEKSIIYIITRLYNLTKSFCLRFNNISSLDIARDTPVQLYFKMSEIYYQSTKCNKTVTMLIGNPPLYKPVSKTKMYDYPDDNGISGTFIIGAKKSAAMVSIYNKTNEIVNNCHKKNYIQEIHNKHFGLHKNISRCEVQIFANAFSKRGILYTFKSSLIEILIPTNLPLIYFKALGDKLTFSKLLTKTWDAANNDKYEKIRLIPLPDIKMINYKKMLLEPNKIRFTHNNNINKYKYKLVEYLDNEITFSELKRYFIVKKSKYELNLDELDKAFKIVLRNYHNILNPNKKSRVQKMILSFEKVDLITSIKYTILRIFQRHNN